MSSEIKVDTISENTSANGVAIDSLGIKDGKITNLMNATLSAADLGNVHIKTADSSASVHADADELVIEGSANSGMSVLSGTSGYGTIYFGDSGDNNIGAVQYEHSSNSLYLVTSAATAIKVDGSGHVTKPLQPSFLLEVESQDNIATNTNITVKHSNEIFDIGSNFNTSTYQFTAPVTGKYQFNVSIRLDNIDTAADYYQTRLSMSNRTITIDTIDPGGFSTDILYYQGGSSVVADMDANDTAHVQVRQQAGTAQTDVNSTFDGTFFSGHLIG